MTTMKNKKKPRDTVKSLTERWAQERAEERDPNVFGSAAWYEHRSDRASCTLDLIRTLADLGTRLEELGGTADGDEQRNRTTNILFAIQRLAEDAESQT